MSTLALRAPATLPSPREMRWDDPRALEIPTRPRSQPHRIELPSIRTAVPEIEQPPGRNDNTYYSPVTHPRVLFTPPEYSQSPSLHKRRRLSSEEDQELESREHLGPRLYRSPTRPSPRSLIGAISPTLPARRYTLDRRCTIDFRDDSPRNSPYISTRGPPVTRSPPGYEPTSTTRSSEWRPQLTLPDLPSLTHTTSTPRGRNSFSEYALDSSGTGACQTYPQPPTSTFDPPMYQPSSLSRSQQPRGQSYSGPSYSMSHDRTPFSSNFHYGGFPASSSPYGLEVSDGGNDSKQRKRRGNLPKETTDKLRAWFIAHLQHPYPTEDEKQDLMRQTGLQMNQISNWFINARRRQLPAMINNARAESDARSARSGEGLHSENASDYGDEKRIVFPLEDSDGEESVYEENEVGLSIRPVPTLLKREVPVESVKRQSIKREII